MKEPEHEISNDADLKIFPSNIAVNGGSVMGGQ
jgi:hypothetical protein